MIHTNFSHRSFRDCNLQPVPYDGSPVTWRVSAYAVIIKDGQVLLVKNQDVDVYDVIGGGIELGESIEDCLHREAQEEAGATITIGSLLTAVTDWFHHRNGKFYQTILLFYQAELAGELLAPSDSRVEWRGFVPLSQIGEKYPVLPYVAELIRIQPGASFVTTSLEEQALMDAFYEKATKVVKENPRITMIGLQKKLWVDFARVSALWTKLKAEGLVR